MTSVLEFELRLDEAGDHRRGVRLRSELSAALRDARVVSEVDDVDVAQPPSDHRAADMEIIGLLVSTVGTIAAVIQVVQDFLHRRAAADEAPTISLRIGDVTVVIADPPTSQELDMIGALIERYDGGDRA
ncbi:hypothetical protein J4573_01250 [Actinomadura barringtoniae]|uniref:Uncharacterized protein n=1 Tax=Actinomadura barringtoniae TaxID=1427535 RepID=A0A939P5L4_9ACTN|nr:hypothetical protein [Actinomadura barringtoniae]MBO2445707.1 hypothetical protein [Actinomadura barringtoniae]